MSWTSRLTKESLHIAPAYQPQFEALGWSSYASLTEAEIGTPLSQEKGGREVRTLVLPAADGSQPPETLFLKRRGKESLWPLWPLFFKSGQFHSGPVRERLMLQQLRRAGFAAVEPVAWGERRRCGIPLGGFLISRGIPGASAAEVFEASRGKRRLQCMNRLGGLVGRLHRHGFLQPVRLKDLILEADGEFVLIDRETSKPWPKRFSPWQALRSLSRAARRTLRDGHRPGAGSACHFLRGYQQSMADQWNITPLALTARFLRNLRRELRPSRPE